MALGAAQEYFGGDGQLPGDAEIPPYSGVATSSDLMSLYLYGDPHHGMMAHKAETGANHDLKISIRNHKKSLEYLSSCAEPGSSALLITVGDTFHQDNTYNQTNRSKHILDVDTRWDKLVRDVAALWVWKVEHLLLTHHHVFVEIIRGNHDDHSAVALQVVLWYAFRDHPHVSINISPAYLHAHVFGQNFFGFWHGHTVKEKDVSDVFERDFPELWQATKHRHLYQGHLHHRFVYRDLKNAHIECLRTLATADSYAAAGGYRSFSGAKMDTFHNTAGHLTSHYAPLDLIWAQ